MYFLYIFLIVTVPTQISAQTQQDFDPLPEETSIKDDISNLVEKGKNIDLNKVDAWFEVNFSKSEEFRKDKYLKLKQESERLQVLKKEAEDGSTPVKVMTFLHWAAIVLLTLILSTTIVFYSVVIFLVFLILRLLWRVLARFFQKEY